VGEVHVDRLVDQPHPSIAARLVGGLLRGQAADERGAEVEVGGVGEAGCVKRPRIWSTTSRASAYASADGVKSGMVRWNISW